MLRLNLGVYELNYAILDNFDQIFIFLFHDIVTCRNRARDVKHVRHSLANRIP